jgi:hypothetical protein
MFRLTEEEKEQELEQKNRAIIGFKSSEK